MKGTPSNPPTDAIFTMDPPPLLSMPAISYFIHRATPSNMTSKFVRHSDAGSSTTGAGVPAMPAPLTAPSSPPNFLTARSTIAWMDFSSVTSVAMNSAMPPPALTAAATFRPRVWSRSASTTFAPSCAKRWAHASPMPEAAPVMTIALSVRFIVEPPFFRMDARDAGCLDHPRIMFFYVLVVIMTPSFKYTVGHLHEIMHPPDAIRGGGADEGDLGQ